jgi:hypothetical protein
MKPAPNIERAGRTVEERVADLMIRLDSLLEGPQAAAHLVACGTAAVPPLRRFLVEGRPRGVFQTRVWAAQALGGLGADDVLLEYLRGPIGSSDPVVRFAEQTVRSAAAKILAESQLPGVSETLLDIAREERLPGALDAVAERDPETATPILIAALEDDFARDAAQAALHRLGAAVCDALVDTALDPGAGTEAALRRRRAALALLLHIDFDTDTWQRLERLLDEEDAQLVCAVSLLGVERSPNPGRIARRLVDLLPTIGWDWLGDVEEIVVRCTARSGGDLRLLLPLPADGEHRAGVLMVWQRICRRINEAAGRR